MKNSSKLIIWTVGCSLLFCLVVCLAFFSNYYPGKQALYDSSIVRDVENMLETDPGSLTSMLQQLKRSSPSEYEELMTVLKASDEELYTRVDELAEKSSFDSDIRMNIE